MPRPFASLGPRGFLTDEEKKNMPKVTKPLLRRIFSYLKPYWKSFLLVFLAIFAASVIGLLPSVITGRIVDEALIGRDLTLLLKLLAAAFLTVIASQLVGVLESQISIGISQRIICDMKNEMYRHLQHMPQSFFATEKQGDIITRMNTDIDGVSAVVSDTLTTVVSNVVVVGTTLTALFMMSWKLAIVGMIVIPLLILPTKRVGRTRWKLTSERQQHADELNQQISETLSVSGSTLVKLFTREQAEYERFRDINDRVTQAAIRERRSGRWFGVVAGMFTQIGPLLIYFAGGWLIIARLDAGLTVGAVTATVALINRLYRPVQSLFEMQVNFTRSLALFTRIFDYLDKKNTIVSPPRGKKPDVAERDIRFDHVSFGYEPGQSVLTDVSLTVPGGSMYAIVGPSGSGKSTLINLIPRLYDVSGGSVSIAGTDVREFDLTYLRQCIGIVTQDAYLFNGTVLENLLYAKEGAAMDEVERACRVASIHDFIAAQPDGYGTIVGNRGLKLSGGEKQRISIARAILKNPRILILDEATSSLDSISESAIQEALETLMRGRTSIVIAHRLTTILKADRILVLRGGAICEQGGHEELLQRGGVYRELYETQFRKVLEYEAGERQDGA